VDTVVVTGFVTELCVLGTASGGFEHGFHVVVPRESTASVDPGAAEAALSLIARYYGSVVSLADGLAALTRA
jgi:nicotinamidase-related amidase